MPQLLRIFPYSAAQLTANDQYKRLLAGWAAGGHDGGTNGRRLRSAGPAEHGGTQPPEQVGPLASFVGCHSG